MNNTATNTTTCPTVRKQIGKTTYIVRVHFSPVSYTHLDVYKRQMMSGDDRQNSPSISRQNRPSATLMEAFPTQWLHLFLTHRTRPVSYTHLDVYKRQSTRLLPPIWADKRIYHLRMEGNTMYRRVLPLLLTAVLLLSGFHKAL